MFSMTDCGRLRRTPDEPAMPLNDWSDTILIAELSDEPAFSEDMDALRRRLEKHSSDDIVPNVIINMKCVSFVNSSNIAQLLTIRKKLTLSQKRLRISGVSDSVWTVL